MSRTTLCELSELSEGNGKYVDIDGTPLAVFLHEGEPYVIDDLCPHAGGELSGGWVEQVQGKACAVCPLHGWPFALDDGEMPGGGGGVRTYPAEVEERDGKRFVTIDLAPPAI